MLLTKENNVLLYGGSDLFCSVAISITGTHYCINAPCCHRGDILSWVSVNLIYFLARNDPIEHTSSLSQTASLSELVQLQRIYIN